MYHVYNECEDYGEILTPSYTDAMRQMRKLSREFPCDVITIDKLHDWVDIGDFSRRELICQVCPE